MSAVYKLLPHYTYKDYCQWEGRWEIIEGIPYAMSPSPIPKHQRVANEIKTELTVALRKAKCKHCRVYDFVDYKITEDTILEPDGLVICGQIDKKFLDFAPVLVLEVLSPSTALKDRNTKFNLYQQQGIAYYIIADVEKDSLEIYALVNDIYILQTNTNLECVPFTFNNECSINVNFNSVFV